MQIGRALGTAVLTSVLIAVARGVLPKLRVRLSPLCGARLVWAKENKSTIPSLRSSLKMNIVRLGEAKEFITSRQNSVVVAADILGYKISD